MALILKPIAIKGMELANRLVMPPMATAKSTASGEVTQALCDYYARCSSGGYIGLIITEHSYVSRDGQAGKGQLSIARDDDILGLRKLVSGIHSNGTKVLAQLSHSGAAANSQITGCDVLGVTAAPVENAVSSGSIPREMSQSDIDRIISDFAQAAVRAKQAGFDGVEIHSAHGYLLNQFYSPLSNKRTDKYTGSTLDGRIRIHLEIIQAIRESVGENYIVALRLGASDYTAGGTTIEDSIKAAIAFQNAGIDLLDVSGGFRGYLNPKSNEQGYFGELSQAIKAAVDTPVLLTGGIKGAQAAENLLITKKTDLIGVGRAILKDLEWPKKAMAVLSPV